MKRFITYTLAAATVFCSCQQINLDEYNNASQQEEIGSTKNVRFNIYGFQEELETRATLTEGNVTDLYIFDNGTQICHQTSTDADFGSPTLNLTYDTHSLSFVATSGVTTVSNNTLSWTSVKETFAKTLSLVVDGKTQSQNVNLSRWNAKFKLTITDIIPNDAATIQIVIPSSFGISTTSLEGTTPTDYTYSANISSWAGKSNKYLAISLLTPNSEQFTRAVTITFIDSEGETITEIQKTCTFQRNHQTHLSGNCFNTNPLNTLTLDTDWGDDIEESIQ